ncbi:MAG: peptidylprolyl isomerase [Verrucomicrobiales bacterium]|nr:peptidylprolyl isomerase [Verrucomicrobiales bacterium]
MRAKVGSDKNDRSGGLGACVRSGLGRATASSMLLALALTLAGAAVLAPATEAATVLARGKDVEVTQEQLDEAFINLRATLAAQGRSMSEAQRPTIERQLIDKLALTQILLGRASEEDRKRATDKVAKLIDEQKTRARTEARFEAQIRASGLTPENFRKQLEERAICEEVLDRELRPKLGVTPEKVRSYFDQNPAEFRQPERLRLRQIVLTLKNASGGDLPDGEKAEKRKLADRLRERLGKGEDIATLAREFSDDPGGRERSGEYVFPVGRMVQELETAVSGLKTNEISPVITTPYAYHLVQVAERLSGELIPFDSVTNRIQIRMELEATQTLLPEYQKQLFEAAKVEMLTPAK